jgi:hypothetical protein
MATRRRKAERAEAQSLRQIPSARSIARLLTISRDTLSKSETISVAAIEDQVPLLVEVREIVAAFHDMILIASSFNQDPQGGPSLWLGPHIVGRPNEVLEPM